MSAGDGDTSIVPIRANEHGFVMTEQGWVHLADTLDEWACGVTAAQYPVKVTGAGSNPVKSIPPYRRIGLEDQNGKPAGRGAGLRWK